MHSRIRQKALGSCLLLVAACSLPQRVPEIEPPILDHSQVATVCAQSDADADCQWRSVREVTWTESGLIAVLDGPRDIRLFSNSGEPRGALGGSGDGPGEFRFVADMRASHEPAFYALDVRHFRVEVFDTARRVTASIPVPIRPLASGIKLSGKSSAYLEVDPGDSLGAIVPAHISFVSFDSTQAERRVAFTSRAQRRKSSEFQAIPRPFAPELLWDVNATGEAVVGYGDSEELVVYDTLGRPRTTIRGRWPAVRLSSLQRDSAAARLMNPGGRPSASTAYTERTKQLIAQLPEFLPRIQEVRLTSDGAVWLRRNASGAKLMVWEWFDRSGQRVGALPLDAGVRLVGADHDRVALAVSDSTGRVTLHIEQIKVSPITKSRSP